MSKDTLQTVKEALEDNIKTAKFLIKQSECYGKRGCYKRLVENNEKALKELAAYKKRLESEERLGIHASKGKNSFVTRLENAFWADHNGICTVNKRDLKDILWHFIRLDNAARELDEHSK